MKARLISSLLITLLGASAIIVDARTKNPLKQYSLRTFPHHASLLVDNHLVIGDIMLPILNRTRSLWYWAFQTQTLYQSLGSLVSIGSGYRTMLTPYFIYGGHLYLDIGQRLAQNGYYSKFNIGVDAYYKPNIRSTLNFYLPLQFQCISPEKTYEFRGHQKIETRYLEQDQTSIDAQLTLTRFNKIKPFLGFYYHHQQAQDVLLGITVGTDVTILPNFKLGLQYHFDQFHKHYIRLGLQLTHQHNAGRQRDLQQAFWQKPVRHISPLDLQSTQATEQQYFFFKKQDSAALRATQATAENPSSVLTQALVNQAKENTIFLIENPPSFVKAVDILAETIGPKAHLIFPEDSEQILNAIVTNNALQQETITLCDETVECVKITQPSEPSQQPIFILSKFPYGQQEFTPHSNEEVEIILKPGQQLIGTTNSFSKKPRYAFERPALRQVFNLANDTKLENINLYPLNRSSAHTVLEKNTNAALSTNTGIIIHNKNHVTIQAVDLLGSKEYSYETGIELANTPHSQFQNIHIRNAKTGMAIKNSPYTDIKDIIIGSTFKLGSAIIELPTIQSQYGIIIEEGSDNTHIERATINSQNRGIDVSQSNITLRHSKLCIGHCYSSLDQKDKLKPQNKRITLSGTSVMTAIRILSERRFDQNQIAIENRSAFDNNKIDIYANNENSHIAAVHAKGPSTHLSIGQNTISYFIAKKASFCKPEYIHIPEASNQLPGPPLKHLTLVDNTYHFKGPKSCLELINTLDNRSKAWGWIMQNNTSTVSVNDSGKMAQLKNKLPTKANLLGPFLRHPNVALEASDITSSTSSGSSSSVDTDSTLVPKYYKPNIKETLHTPSSKVIDQQYLQSIQSIYQQLSDQDKHAIIEHLIQDLSMHDDDIKIKQWVVKIHQAMQLTNGLDEKIKLTLQFLYGQWSNTISTQHNIIPEVSEKIYQEYLNTIKKTYQRLSHTSKESIRKELEGLIQDLSMTDMNIHIALVNKIHEAISSIIGPIEKHEAVLSDLKVLHDHWLEKHSRAESNLVQSPQDAPDQTNAEHANTVASKAYNESSNTDLQKPKLIITHHQRSFSDQTPTTPRQGSIPTLRGPNPVNPSNELVNLADTNRHSRNDRFPPFPTPARWNHKRSPTYF